jgi:MerR family transcriptional regulator/heat shock protein HspR
MLDDDRPLYTIGTAAEVLQVHPRTLRLYEESGLISPARKNNRRFYSNNDLKWVGCIRYLIHEKGLNQEGLRRLLALTPCWEIKGCSDDEQTNCAAVAERTAPCWSVKHRTSQKHNSCHTCEVYLSARERATTKEEREASMTYVHQ